MVWGDREMNPHDYLTPSEHAITENIRSLTTLRGHNCRKQLIKIKKQRLKVNRYNKNELVKNINI